MSLKIKFFCTVFFVQCDNTLYNCYMLQEKLRKRIHFHGTNWETLSPFIDKSVRLTKHGGDLTMTDELYCVKIWENIHLFENVFKGNH